MASIVAKSAVSSAAAASKVQRSAAFKPVAALKPSVKAAPAPASAQANKMMVWQPTNNKMFETFSYLPPLNDDQIARQVDYIVGNGWTPCLEFSETDLAYVSNANTVRFGPVSSNYYDNRYWTMWKLPMFGCTDPMQVLKEINSCTRAFPDAFVRIVAFDPLRQVQVMGFLVQRPKSSKDWCPVADRSVSGDGSRSTGGSSSGYSSSASSSSSSREYGSGRPSSSPPRPSSRPSSRTPTPQRKSSGGNWSYSW